MKSMSTNIALIALACLAAIAMIIGHPLISPESLVSLGMVPLAVGNIDFGTIKDLLQKQGDTFDEFKAANNSRFKTLEEHLIDIEKKGNRPGAGWEGSNVAEKEHKQAFLGYLRSGRDSELQHKAMATSDDPNGGYMVPVQVDSIISKALRNLSPMRQLARVVEVKTGDYSMLHSVGGTVYSWVGGISRPTADRWPKFGGT